MFGYYVPLSMFPEAAITGGCSKPINQPKITMTTCSSKRFLIGARESSVGGRSA